MKKLLVLVAVLLGTATGFAQGYSAPVRVIVTNKTNYNLYYAPRYHLAFYDGFNNTSFFGVTNAQLGIPTNAPTKDFNYQPEGIFEPVLNPGQQRVYMNSTNAGYPFQPNGGFSSFNTTGVTMTGFQVNPSFFYKYVRLDWIRFAMSTTTLANAFYGGGLAHPVPSSGFPFVSATPPDTGGGYVGPFGEMIIPFWASTTSFTYSGVTINAVWTATAYTPGQVQTVNILFYQ